MREEPRSVLESEGGKERDRAVRLAVAAAEEAIRQSRITGDAVAPDRWAVVLASCRPGLSANWEPSGADEPPRVALELMPRAMAEELSAGLDLKPGRYYVLCDIPTAGRADGEPHSAHGMVAAFTVK